jgi:hypothetical protein
LLQETGKIASGLLDVTNQLKKLRGWGCDVTVFQELRT